MVSEGSRVRELLLTDTTGKRLLTCVCPHMHLQRGRALKLHRADFAAELLLADVRLKMLF